MITNSWIIVSVYDVCVFYYTYKAITLRKGHKDEVCIVEEKQGKKYVCDNAQLMEEWDWDKNTEVIPALVSLGSGKKVWWKHWHEETKQWHSWQASIANRAYRNSWCPYCSKGRPQLLKGFNDLETWCLNNHREEIIKEWDYNRNKELPSDYLSKSHKKVWWMCSFGHSWDMSIAHRTSMESGCPICANLRVEKGFNDLETWCKNNGREELIKEWDYERNDYTPNLVVPQSHKKVYWKCKLGHTWEAIIKDRVIRKDGCPECSKRRRTSFPEQAIYFYVKKVFPDAINEDRNILEGLELDIFIPTINVAIEYDGQAYHKDLARDKRKNDLCRERGIAICRVRENGCDDSFIEECSFFASVAPGNAGDLTRVINMLLEYLTKTAHCNAEYDVDVQRDQIEIQNTYIVDELPNSFEQCHPDLAEEWDYLKNGDITPDKIAKSTHQKFFWICKKGHPSYLASPASRNLGSGCPVCANRQVLIGYNDLRTWCYKNGRRELLDEWDYEKNSELPEFYLPKSNIRVFWKCKSCGHSWETKIEDRTARSRGCPICAIQKRAQKNSKKVLNKDTGEIFKNASEAREKYKGNITGCCLGNIKTAAGYHWTYLEDE